MNLTKTFHPVQTAFVDASFPHPEKTQYKISVGTEFFDGVPQTVVMVQMVYAGRVEGRKSPSFPIGTDDFMRVNHVANELINSFCKGDKNHE